MLRGMGDGRGWLLLASGRLNWCLVCGQTEVRNMGYETWLAERNVL